MDLEFSSAEKFFLLNSCRCLCLAAALLAYGLSSSARAEGYGSNIFPAGGFDNVAPTYVPWSGIDAQGNIHGIDGKQLAVDDNGHIPQEGVPFAPSVSVGDLNGDGKLDLVVADAHGFFWYYPNTGTPQSPAFTQGEVMPIWLGLPRSDFMGEAVENIVPRLQLVDTSGTKRLDIFAGTYRGALYHIRNEGSAVNPQFRPTKNLDLLTINTRKQGVLWCNYLTPNFTSLFGGPNSLDMIMGEGTYSANSIYLLHNTGSPDSPTFDEDHTKKIIPGMGLEQLTPAIVDWNNDGKPDVISGDRTGDLMLYLNTSKDSDNITFDAGTKVAIAGQSNFGGCITVTVADLTGNHLPNLLIGKADGTIVYATNTGKLGAPAFNTAPTPLKGILPPDFHQFMRLTEWWKGGAWGDAYEMMCATNPQLEPGFTFPEGEKTKYAMRFYVWPYKSVYFPQRFLQTEADEFSEHSIGCREGFTLKLNKPYRLHFWVKSDGNIGDFRVWLKANGVDRDGFHASDIVNAAASGSTWTEVSQDIEEDDRDDKTVTTWGYQLEFHFTGQTPFYIDDLQIQEVQ